MTIVVSGRTGLLRSLVASRLRDAGLVADVQERPAVHDAGRVEVRAGREADWVAVVPEVGLGQAAAQALADGAASVVGLESEAGDLVRAVEALLGERPGFVPIDLARWIARSGGPPAAGGAPKPPQVLTAREREVLALVARGMTNGEIAAALLISVNTVRTHLHTLATKLDASSRTKLLARARGLGIAEAFESTDGTRASA
ncbi:MAG: response regulator transcription factor [Dehalococcoidia bacterium]